MVKTIEWQDFVDQISPYLAEYLHDEEVRIAIQDIDSKEFNLDDLGEIFTRLQNESDTAMVLIFSSYFEEKFYKLFVRHLVNIDSKRAIEDLFGASRPLNSFYSRVSLAFHLGWISNRTKTKIDALRRIRNEFSHRAYSVSLQDTNISRQFDTICSGLEEMLHPVLKASEKWLESLGYRISWDVPLEGKSRQLCGLAILLQLVTVEMLSIPVSLRMKVGPFELSKAKTVDHVHRAGIAAFLNVLIAVGHIVRIDGSPGASLPLSTGEA